MKRAAAFIFVLLTATVLLSAYGYGGGPGFMRGGWGYGASWMGVVHMIFRLLIPAALIVLAVLGFTKLLKNTKRQDSGSSLTILKNRYAKGEITEDEYRKMKEIIED